MNKTRLEAFSDGVIAIIITIMVLELKMPEGADWHALKTLAPVFTSYIFSFSFVGIYWVNHHHLLHTVKKVSGGMLWANLNLLFWLSLIPFATSWMGENHFIAFTVAVYATLLLGCGIAFTILQKTIENSIEDKSHFTHAMQGLNRKGKISVVAYTLAIPLAYVHPAVSAALFVFVSLIWMVPDKNIERAVTNE